MEHDDPHRGNTEFDYQQAGRGQHADRLPTGASRRFVASLPFFGSKWNAKRGTWIMYGAMALLLAPLLAISLVGRSTSGLYDTVGVWARPLFSLLVVLVLVGIAWLYFQNSRRKIVIDVARDGLTVSGRPGEVFAFRDARLGPWAFWQSMGSALHLSSGAGQFVLGGRDHRISAGAHADAPPIRDVDAWLWAADFDELLTIAGRRGGDEPDEFLPTPEQLGPRQSVRGDATRCALFPNPEAVSVQPLWAPWRTTRIAKSFMLPKQSNLAIDVGADTVSVVDPTTNVVHAAAPLSQITVAAEVFLLLRPYIFMWPVRFFPWGYVKNFQWTTPVLVVSVPGLEPVSISCRDDPGNDYLFVLTQTLANRFSWNFKPPYRINKPAEYSISAADWLTLVEAFGLTRYLEDRVKRY